MHPANLLPFLGPLPVFETATYSVVNVFDVALQVRPIPADVEQCRIFFQLLE